MEDVVIFVSFFLGPVQQITDRTRAHKAGLGPAVEHLLDCQQRLVLNILCESDVNYLGETPIVNRQHAKSQQQMRWNAAFRKTLRRIAEHGARPLCSQGAEDLLLITVSQLDDPFANSPRSALPLRIERVPKLLIAQLSA